MRSPKRGTVVRSILVCCLLAGTAMLASAGCGGSANAICNSFCECTGCTATDFDLCVQRIENSELAASDARCSPEADEYEACVAERGTCVARFYITDGCEVPRSALAICLGRVGCNISFDGSIHC